jgi:hypothetical protein
VALDREQGPLGAVIVGRTGGSGAFGEQVPRLSAYLVPSRIVSGLDQTVSNEQALRANHRPLGRYRRRTVQWAPVGAGVLAGLLVTAAAWKRGRRGPLNLRG